MTYMINTAKGWRPFLALNVPCPNSNDLQGVFRPQTIEQAQAEMDRHAEAFTEVLVDGSINAVRNFRWPMSGAFGEKL